MNRRTFSKTAAALPIAALTTLGTVETETLKAASLSASPVALPEGAKLTPDALEVIELDKQAEVALPKMDVEFLGKLFADGMLFTHGDQWTGKNVVGSVNTKEQWL